MPDNQTVPLDASPASRIATAIERFGEAVVADRAAALLGGANEGEEFLLWVGGQHAQGILDGAPALYWPEVWGARALLTAWDDSVTPTVAAGLGNQAWRVREMCARVIVARNLPLSASAVGLLVDEVPRVRAAAARVIGAVGDATEASGLRALLADPEIEVRRAAGESLRSAEKRIGHPIP